MKSFISLKGASGLGDSIYAYPICKYYAARYETVNIMSKYPVLFQGLKNVNVYDHKKVNYINTPSGDKIPIDIRFTYCGKKYTAGTSQFQDSCESAGIKESINLSIPWKVKNIALIEYIKDVADGRPICMMAAPYEPFGREDQWGKLLRIDSRILYDIVESRPDVCFVQIGNKYTLHSIETADIDIINETSVSDLMDIASICDIGLSQVGNLLPMCESQCKKTFIIYSRKAVESDNKFISAIVPEKVTHFKKLNTSIYDDDTNHVKRFNESLYAR